MAETLLASIPGNGSIIVKDGAGAFVSIHARTLQFSNSFVVTAINFREVFIDVAAPLPSGPSWLVTGNTGAGKLLGTLDNNSWSFISNGVIRGGFLNTGEMFLKTHSGGAVETRKIEETGITTSVGNVFSPIFSFLVPASSSGSLTVSVNGRKDDGTERASFERKVLFFNEGLGAQLSSKVHFIFTDKSNNDYEIQISTIVDDVLISVRGALGDTVNWSGYLTYQMTS